MNALSDGEDEIFLSMNDTIVGSVLPSTSGSIISNKVQLDVSEPKAIPGGSNATSSKRPKRCNVDKPSYVQAASYLDENEEMDISSDADSYTDPEYKAPKSSGSESDGYVHRKNFELYPTKKKTLKKSRKELDTSNSCYFESQNTGASRVDICMSTPVSGNSSRTDANSNLLVPAHNQSNDLPNITLSNSQKRRNRKANKNKPLPRNPHGLVFTDENGQIIPSGSREHVDRFGTHEKHDPETSARYRREYEKFENYVKKHVTDGSDKLDLMYSKSLDPEDASQMLASYIFDRINETHFRETGEVRPVDTTTMDRLWYGWCHMFKVKTDFDPQAHPGFKSARDAKESYCRKAKQVPGLGELANQSVPWTLPMVKF